MMEVGIFVGNDAVTPMTRTNSPLPAHIAKMADEDKIVRLNLEKRKSLMKIEARRPHIGDTVANKMKKSVEDVYER